MEIRDDCVSRLEINVNVIGCTLKMFLGLIVEILEKTFRRHKVNIINYECVLR